MLAQPAAFAYRLISGSPLRHPRFRLFYVGSIGSALAYTMQATIAAWLMATLTPSALMVALVQTASTAPTLLFGLIAGTLADIVERRHIILLTQLLLFAATAMLGVATLVGFIGPLSLLFLTFIVGAGFTFYLPAQQASINELVVRNELARAVALGAVAFNVARAVGPALVGVIAALLGSGTALIAAAVFFIPMFFSARRLKSAKQSLPGVPETLRSGIVSGVRYARHSTAMRALVIRNLSFAMCASAFWALLPVIARDQLQLGAGGFGLLSAGFGAGAVVGALSIPRQLQHRPVNTVVTLGVFLWVASMLIIAATGYTAIALLGTFGGGFAWVSVFASLSAATQSSAPAWVRARALAINLVAVQASLAAGSAVWGAIATGIGTHIALAISAGALVLLTVLHRNVRVKMGNEADVTMGMPVADLGITGEPGPDDGPVLIQWEYRIPAANHEAFLRAIHAVAPTRRRNGAVSWRVFRDLGDEGRFVERYIVQSWAEYVRLRNRMTLADRELQERVEKLQSPEAPIRISRLIGVREIEEDES
ncbi:MAG TPA: MFS transporter [Casimicrobiaceae bacterium]|nr:MFS transporter [Casimicrobiaceae bacterium]